MSIETKVQSGMDFPEVTICNANPYNAEKVNASGVPKNEYGTPLPSSPEEMSNLTQPLENFIFDSRFNGEQVNIAQHWKPFITNEQICFQFQTDELVRRPGASGGLFVTARTNSIGNLATAGFFGVRVYISQQGATEVNQQHYTLAQPNAFHSRSIQRDVVELETRDPWSRCIFSAPNYTQPKCQQQCRADQVANTCKCREFVDTENTNLPYCHLGDLNDLDACYRKILNDTDDGCGVQCTKECAKPSCSEVRYTWTSSFPASTKSI